VRESTIFISAALLALFAVAGTTLVAFTQQQTAGRIAANQRAALLSNLQQLVPADRYDNALEVDTTILPPLDGAREPIVIYRARLGGQPVAAIYDTTTREGYSGTIRLLVGIWHSGEVAGVRVISHRETPGLGDSIEIERSPWILAFDGRSLGNPAEGEWKVRKDGGVFDQFTGATITPRAIVRAVYRALVHFRANRNQLFQDGRPPNTSEPDIDNGQPEGDSDG
jgi:electron transport complex protein RnfG